MREAVRGFADLAGTKKESEMNMNICGKINGECAVGFKGRKGRF